MALVESVPNVSEGRRPDVVDRLAAALESVPGAHLLDRTSDPSHNRSVFTLAGEDSPVADALERLVDVALREIDMEQQAGEHPRIGAVDVVPFVPLGETTLDECVGLARAFGRRIAARFDLPVYLYAAAATRPDRVKLSDLRRGQYEGLREEIATRGREPDFGPARTHPRGGATCVGARPFLIAWNVNLASADLDLARRIAHRVRESSGGLPAVQAKGFFIEELGCAQVSMNLLDFGRTPLWAAWEAVREEAAAGRRGARRIGADRARPAGGLRGRGRPGRRAARCAAGGAGPRRRTVPEAARRVAAHGAGAAPGTGRRRMSVARRRGVERG